MKKIFLIVLFALCSLEIKSQFLIFLDKVDIFKSPEVDMVVMDKYSFAKYNFISEKYDSLKKEIVFYDSLLQQRDSTEKEIERDYDSLVKIKNEKIADVTEAYFSMKANLQESIDRQNKLQVDYLKLQKKDRRARRWRNFFMGTTAVCGAIIYILIK